MRRPPLLTRLVASCVVATSLVGLAVAAPASAATGPAGPARTEAPTPTGFGSPGTPVRPNSERYVREAFQGVLGRDIDEAGLRHWGTYLDGGGSRASFARALVLSTEALRRELRDVYGVLDRTPTSAELTADATAIRAGRTSLEAVLLRLVASNEYHEGPGGGRDTTFVAALYRDLLGREVLDSDPGAAAWVDRLAAGTPRISVAKAFVYSAERLLGVIGARYDRILARAGDAAGRAHWLAQIRRGSSILDVSRSLLASGEAWTWGCSTLDPTRCLLPFPNDELTVADPTTDTGRRVLLKPSWVPGTTGGPYLPPAPFAPAEWNRQDGFSPGAAILVGSVSDETTASGAAPVIDPVASGLAPITDIGSSLDPDAPLVIVDLSTGERWPYWAETDANATTDAERALVVRPARNYLDGHTYAVGIGPMRTAAGEAVPAPRGFRVFRDEIPSPNRRTNERRAGIESAIDAVVAAGLERNSLHMAWTFTVASTRNLAERAVHMRDEALGGSAGQVAADFTVTEVEPDAAEQVTRVEGTFEVPNYLTGTGATGSTLRYGPDHLPEASGTTTADFVCVVPDSARTTPARPSLYGHGLLGSPGETGGGYGRSMAREHNMVYCGSSWIGLAGGDIGTVVTIVSDLSRFPQLADRTQQAFLNFMVLGRLMTLPDGFATDPAFQSEGGDPVIDPSRLYYDGNSQGGIMGGSLVALSTDITRGALGVPAMNYSTLLERSVDFDTFFTLMKVTYPSALDRITMLGVIQMLWDRGEANGYANHITSDPLPGTPTHEVLLSVAFGDHQVAPVAADVEARTIGAATLPVPVPEGRLPDVTPLWGIDRITTWPHEGSAIVYWDSGSPAPPLQNVPPRAGRDPHSDPRSTPASRQQISTFLQPDGVVVDVCDGQPCLAVEG